MKRESWLRRKIERKLFLRFHFFEDGWEVNKEFMRWKLEFYLGGISSVLHPDIKSLGDCALFISFLILSPLIYLVIMPLDVLKTPFITSYWMSQKHFLMRWKFDHFGIRDIRDPHDYIMHLERQRLVKEGKINSESDLVEL